LDAFVHTADVFAILGASVADFGADSAKTLMESGTAQHEVGRCLADFGTAHHHTEMFRFNVFSAGHEAVIHSRLQTNLMAIIASIYARLHRRMHAMHGLFRAHRVFRISWLSHEISPELKNKRGLKRQVINFETRMERFQNLKKIVAIKPAAVGTASHIKMCKYFALCGLAHR
jgi:hypothetical protein